MQAIPPPSSPCRLHKIIQRPSSSPPTGLNQAARQFEHAHWINQRRAHAQLNAQVHWVPQARPRIWPAAPAVRAAGRPCAGPTSTGANAQEKGRQSTCGSALLGPSLGQLFQAVEVMGRSLSSAACHSQEQGECHCKGTEMRALPWP